MAPQEDQSSALGGGFMELTDEDWALVLDVARRAVLAEGGDEFLADDIAAQTAKKLLSRHPEIEEGKLAAYTRRMAKNLYIDEIRRRQRAMLAHHGLPDDDEDVASAFAFALKAKSPSEFLIKSERNHRRLELAWSILNSLNDRQRRLIELTVAGRSNDEIARDLGYKNPATVSATRTRVYRMLENQFRDQFSPSLFSTGGTGNW